MTASDVSDNFAIQETSINSSYQSHEPRSPATYPNRPPLRRREIVMPVPLGHQLAPNPMRQGSTPSPSKHAVSLHPVRTESNTTIPAIEVETPVRRIIQTHSFTFTHSIPQSTKSPQSEKTAYDPVLLTPDQAHKPVALPSQPPNEHLSNVALSFDPEGKDSITGVAPDNNLPPGFVPLSPIMAMANLNPYPPGFAPPVPSATPRADFVYPASPLARSQ
jgi:hypothetical protein